MVELSNSELRFSEDLESQMTKADSETFDEDAETHEIMLQCAQNQETMQRQELLQIIEKQKDEIRYLKEKLRMNEAEKDMIIENFQVSTSVLLERLKDFEADKQSSMGHGERPQTATVLSKITAENEGRRIGGFSGGFGTGGLGSGFDGGTPSRQSYDLKDSAKKVPVEAKPEPIEEPDVQCPNCSQMFTQKQVIVHTIQCYRNSTKCKICNEVINKTMKKEHLEKWRKTDTLVQVIKVDDEVKTGLFFDHGLDANGAFGAEAHTPMHIAAQHGSLNVILDLVGRGVAVDPLDKSSRTPLSYAIEKNKYACVRSLIELGADIEHRDSFGRTPIMFACKLGSKEMVELLLQYKADIKATNNMKESCVQFAQKSGNQELIMLLVKHGGSLRPQSGMRRPPSGIKK